MIEISKITRQVQLCVEDNGKTLGFIHLFINGEKGTVYGMNGHKIMKVLIDNIPSLMTEHKVSEVDAVAEENVFYAIKSKCDNVNIKKRRSVEFDNKEMIEFTITRRER